MDTQINNIIVTGDFKFDMLSNHTSQNESELCEQFSLYQTVTELTNFTENSSSLIDIVLTIDKSNVIYSSVAEPFLHQDVRYHCLSMASSNIQRLQKNPLLTHIDQ